MHFDPGRHAWPGGPEHWNPILYEPAPPPGEPDPLAAMPAKETLAAATFAQRIAGQDVSTVLAAVVEDEPGFRALGVERCRAIWARIVAERKVDSVEDLVVLTGGPKRPLSRYNRWSETSRVACWIAPTDLPPDQAPAWLDAEGHLWEQRFWYPDGHTPDSRARLASHYYNKFHPETVAVILPSGTAVRTRRVSEKRYGQRHYFLVVSDAEAVARGTPGLEHALLSQAISGVLTEQFRPLASN